MSAEELSETVGEMAELTLSLDWSKTPVGSPESWPQSLKTTVSMLLQSRFPMFLWWGPDLVQFYNDGYRPSLGPDRHPSALGQRGKECWAEIWPVIGPLIESVKNEGRSHWAEDQLIPITRDGFLQEVYWTFSYSPILDESGSVGGVLVVCSETTARVQSERQLRTLRDLAARASLAQAEEAAWSGAMEVIATNTADVPFALAYVLDVDADSATTGARLVSRTGVGVPSTLAPAAIALDGDAIAPWPLGQLVESTEPTLIRGVRRRLGDVAGPNWPEAVDDVFVLPITRPGLHRPYGFVIAAASPRRMIDDRYRDFFVLVGDQIATAVANARLYEEERRRAEAFAEIDRAKTTFFSNISHEFRTPLSLMIGPTEDLLRGVHGELSGPQRAQLELLRRNELRLQRLVNALLDFSKLEAGRARATFVPTDLSALTRDLASSFRAAMERAGLRFEVDCQPLDEDVFVDRNLWEQVVLNLLSNAFKFTFEGKIAISLRADERHVQLVVEDTGVGIRAQDMPRLFERFHRVEGTRARTHEGSGIGLALVQELVRMHGGTIHAASESGKGTRFTVSVPKGFLHLPQERVELEPAVSTSKEASTVFVEEALRWLPETQRLVSPPALAVESPPAGPMTGLEASAERIIVADDNADMREYLRRILETRWQVETAADGAAALSAVRRSTPALIVTDVMMPGLDGYGLLRELRRDPSTATLPVIMLSARVGDDAQVEGLEAGASDYLGKPFSARELVARIQTQLELARLRKEASTRAADLTVLLMQSPIPICVLRGAELRYELVNPAFEKFIQRTNLVGRRVLDVTPELQGHSAHSKLENVLRTGQAWIEEEFLVPMDGTRDGGLVDTYLRFAATPVRGERGDVERLMLAIIDVTEQVLGRRREDEAAQKIAASESALTKTLHLRDEFLTLASHELRTPLTTLGLQLDGLLRALEERREPEAKVWFRKAERAREQADRLEELVESMLGVFDSGTKDHDLRCEDVDLADLARKAIQRLSSESRRARATLELTAASVVGHWDPRRVEQILAQLLSNALKFGGGKTVGVVVESVGDNARVKVRDQGIGIAPENLERIFERFQRAGSATNYGGFGLGLWIVRELVTAMRGTVRVESDLGRGATFVVELPRWS